MGKNLIYPRYMDAAAVKFILPGERELLIHDLDTPFNTAVERCGAVLGDPRVTAENFGATKHFFIVNRTTGTLVDDEVLLMMPFTLRRMRIQPGDILELCYTQHLSESSRRWCFERLLLANAAAASRISPLNEVSDLCNANDDALRQFLIHLLPFGSESGMGDAMRAEPDGARIFVTVAQALTKDDDLLPFCFRAIDENARRQTEMIPWLPSQPAAAQGEFPFYWIGSVIWEGLRQIKHRRC